MNHQETIEMNHYECAPPSQDAYETLHFKPVETRYRSAEVQQSPQRKKLVFILLAANTLLLVTILVIAAVHYCSVSQPPRFAPSKEEWYLYDDMFYLFWSGQGSCEEANSFCIQRGAQLLTVDSRNEAWVKSVVRERQVWVLGVTNENMSEIFYTIGWIRPEIQCDVFPSCRTASGCHSHTHWVCQKASQKAAPTWY